MSREDSEDRILKAVEDIILKGDKLGINSIANKAGLNKVLIYRYFDGLDGLLTRFAKKINLWENLYSDLKKRLSEKSQPKSREIFIWILKEYRIRLFNSPLYLNLLRLELNEPSPLTKKLEIEREEAGQKIISLLCKKYPEYKPQDLSYRSSFIMSGITYLVLKSSQVDKFTGIKLKDDSTWDNFDATWIKLLD